MVRNALRTSVRTGVRTHVRTTQVRGSRARARARARAHSYISPPCISALRPCSSYDRASERRGKADEHMTTHTPDAASKEDDA